MMEFNTPQVKSTDENNESDTKRFIYTVNEDAENSNDDTKYSTSDTRSECQKDESGEYGKTRDNDTAVTNEAGRKEDVQENLVNSIECSDYRDVSAGKTNDANRSEGLNENEVESDDNYHYATIVETTILDGTDETIDDKDHEETTKETKVLDGGWGWMIVLGVLLLRTVIGGIQRSSGLFYVKFLEQFGGTASKTAWVTSLSMTCRLLIGPLASVLCNRFSVRKLSYFGGVMYVIGIHISAYATSLVYMYFSYGVISGIGRAFLLTPCVMLLGEYFDKRRSLAFGLASAGFGLGGFAITPTVELMFQQYGFRGTYILLSGVACHIFICIGLFRPGKSVDMTRKIKSPKDEELNARDNGHLASHVSSSGSVHLARSPDKIGVASNIDSAEAPMLQKQPTRSHKANAYAYDKDEDEFQVKQKVNNPKKRKIISFSILKDVRFVTLCIAQFIFTLPTAGLFLPALAKSRGLTDIQAASLLSIIAGCDTVFRILSGFVLDLKALRKMRPYIFNAVTYAQCIPLFVMPSLKNFEEYAVVCTVHGALMGIKQAQRSVILVDILGFNKLASSFSFMLMAQGLGTLIGPPLNGYLKDKYGKYDYTFYFGGTAILVGGTILLAGNIRNTVTKRQKKGQIQTKDS
ncbi:monocarboxylate transporter 4-like [Mya arenaria]|uniref:monocarboxylate transporter 4-like n=1 Tax=Mya arenaria TaxID=6604 RepID=UPI0022E15DC7|nr:monocarboxylate transporter 4-like [Mya arenaria]